MDVARKILSDIIVHMKYARYLPEQKRRETWDELVDRNKEMHLKKFPSLKEEIDKAYKLVYQRKVLPSMRSMQFGGRPIEVGPQRAYNCSYLPIDDWRAFQEVMFLLLSGCGVGYSVQEHHIEKLPDIRKPNPSRFKRWLISDSIEGWADAIKVLMKSYFNGGYTVDFDFSDIRAKGSLLVTSGGKAPGPQPLKECILKIEGILSSKNNGDKLKPIEVHDILCHIADAVLAGGIRRSAMISLFNADDEDMLSCKAGSWWELNPQRGRANNSAVLLRHKIDKSFFKKLWKKIELSHSGEPGIYFTNDKDVLTNPCCISGECRILTKDGYIPLKDLEGHIETYNKDGEIVNGVVYKTGQKETIEIKCGNTKRYTSLRVTKDHRLMLDNGSSINAGDLKHGDRIRPYFFLREYSDVTEFKYGFIFGDGTFRKNGSNHKKVEVNFSPLKDHDIIELFKRTNDDRLKRIFTTHVTREDVEKRGIDLSTNIEDKALPCFITNDFLMGLYSANGSVVSETRVSYKTVSKNLAYGLLDLLKRMGFEYPYVTTNKPKIVSFGNGDYLCKESYDVNLSRLSDLIKFGAEIGFHQEYKRDALEHTILKKSPYVFSIKDFGTEDVYDFSLFDDTHWGVIEGLVVHNCEIALPANCFCNLTEINASDIESQADFNERARVAAFIGTLQASYTNFHYLRNVWKTTSEKYALLGIGMTGIASNAVFKYDIKQASLESLIENERVSKMIGINKAARIGCVKPSGTTSILLGTSSGIHAWHNDYYIRRIRVGKNEAIYKYLMETNPSLLEDDYFRPHDTAIITIPQKAPDGATLRNESPLHLLNRVKEIRDKWIIPSHRSGDNTHNVSCTVNIKPDEWESVGEWMWENRDCYNGLSVLPYDSGTYTQAPFEDIDRKTFEDMFSKLHSVDLTKVIESEDDTNLQNELACAGGSCEIQ